MSTLGNLLGKALHVGKKRMVLQNPTIELSGDRRAQKMINNFPNGMVGTVGSLRPLTNRKFVC